VIKGALPDMSQTLQCGRYMLDLSQSARALVMGILNVTPDSFSDGGAFVDVKAALTQAQRMQSDGADIIDVGAESTRPGAQEMSAEQEWARLAPLLPELIKLGVPISVDTYHPSTMKLAIAAGCDMINCVAGFRMPGAIDAVAQANVALCVMHMQGEPRHMQSHPAYAQVTNEVMTFLSHRASALLHAGVTQARIVLDPGYGFGKTAAHNLTLLKQQRELCALGYPILAGLSRKNTLGLIVNKPAPERVAASVAAALFAAQQGARIVRVHDVAQTVDALKVWQAIETGTINTL
jgi:dihydropteroate synthase